MSVPDFCLALSPSLPFGNHNFVFEIYESVYA